MADAYEEAVQAGVSPVEFWQMTPYQTSVAIRGLVKNRAILAWEIAAFSRSKKLPKIDTILGNGKRKSMTDLKQTLQAMKTCRK